MSTPLSKHFFDELLLHPKFWSLVIAYNAHRIPPWQWQSHIPGEFFSGLPNRYRPRGEAKSFYWDFSEESTRIALLPDSLLYSLSRIAGVALNARALASCIVRSEQQQIRAAIGEDMYQYALQRGQYIVGEAEEIMEEYDRDAPLSARTVRHGWRALWFLAQSWPAELCDAFSGLVEAAWETDGIAAQAQLSAPQLSKASREILWRFLKKCLLREVAPSWAQYFTF